MSLRQCTGALARSLARTPRRALSHTATTARDSNPLATPPPPVQQDTDAVHEWVRQRPRPYTPRNPRTDLRHRPDARYLDHLVGADLSAFDPVLDLHPAQHAVLRGKQGADVHVTTINRVPGEVGYRQKKPGSAAPSRRMRGEEASVEHLSQVTQLSQGEIRNLYRFALVIKRVVNMKAKGKIPSMYALVVTGNGHGLVGCGEGKDDAANKAVQKAFAQAVRSLDYVERYEERTVWGTMSSNFGTCKIEMRSRPPGACRPDRPCVPRADTGPRGRKNRLRTPVQPAHPPGRKGGGHHRPVGQGARLAQPRPRHQARHLDAARRVEPRRSVPRPPLRPSFFPAPPSLTLALSLSLATDMGGFMFEKGQRRNKKVSGMMTADEIGKTRGRRAIDVSHGA